MPTQTRSPSLNRLRDVRKFRKHFSPDCNTCSRIIIILLAGLLSLGPREIATQKSFAESDDRARITSNGIKAKKKCSRAESSGRSALCRHYRMDWNYVIVKLSPIARVTRRNATSTKGLISRDSSLPSSRTFFRFFLPYRRSFDRASFPVISFHFQNLVICERRVKIAVNRTTSITFTECPTKCARSAVDVDRSN